MSYEEAHTHTVRGRGCVKSVTKRDTPNDIDTVNSTTSSVWFAVAHPDECGVCAMLKQDAGNFHVPILQGQLHGAYRAVGVPVTEVWIRGSSGFKQHLHCIRETLGAGRADMASKPAEQTCQFWR